MRKLREFPLGSIQSSVEICQWYSIHWFDANTCVMFQEIWNEFIGVKKHDFLMKHNLGKRSINNKLFIHSVNVHKDFFRLLYHSYGLWIILKNESRGMKELYENTWLKSNRHKKRIGSLSICCQWKWSSTCKNSCRDRIRFNHW